MVDLAKLASQGRAKSASQAWEPEELEAVLLLEREGGIGRLVAADHVRNGIMTLEDLKAAQDAGFKPKTREEAEAEVDATLTDNDFATKKAEEKSAKKAKKEITDK